MGGFIPNQKREAMYLPRVMGMQVIDTPPTGHPIGFAPSEPKPPVKPQPFAPQIAARQRI